MLLLSANFELTPEYLSQEVILYHPYLAHKGSGYFVFSTELSVSVIDIYGSAITYLVPLIHKFLLHTDTILKLYTLIECLKQKVFNNKSSVSI